MTDDGDLPNLSAPDPRFVKVGELLAEYAPGAAPAALEAATGAIHAAMGFLVASRRREVAALRGGASEPTLTWIAPATGAAPLRKLLVAAEAGDLYRWERAWRALPSEAVAAIAAEVGGLHALGRLPRVERAGAFGHPAPGGVAPLLPSVIARFATSGRPADVARDLAVAGILRALARLAGSPDLPPPGWSGRSEKSPVRRLLLALEYAYSCKPSNESEGVTYGPWRSALHLDSAETLSRIAAIAFSKT